MTTLTITDACLPHTPIRSAFTVIEKPLRFFYDQYEAPNGNSYRPKNYLMYLGGMVVYPLVICAAPFSMVADMTIGVAECIFCAIVRRDSLADIADLAKKKLVVSPLHHLTFIITSLALPALCLAAMLYQAQATITTSWVVGAKGLLPIAGLFLSFLSTSLVKNAEHAKGIQEMPASIKPLTQNRLLFMAVQTFFVVSAPWNFLSMGFYTLPALSILYTCALPLAVTSLLWTFNYTLSQRMIGSFSSSWNHDTFSIFIDRGALVKLVGTRSDYAGDPKPGQTFQDLAFDDCNTIFWETFAEKCHDDYKKEEAPQDKVEDWNAFWKEFLGDNCQKLNSTSDENKLYTQFREGVLAGKPAFELLGLQENSFDKAAVRKAFHLYALFLHPDKNRGRPEQAELLFKCLNEARKQLDANL
jgi:hypothetical protein